MNEQTCTCTNDCALGFNPNCPCQLAECNCKDIRTFIGKEKEEIFNTIDKYINDAYEMDQSWNRITKNWEYEYKYRKGGRTLCGFYFKKDKLGFMLIFGKEEREKIEEARSSYSSEFLTQYDNATTYRDGKWVMLDLEDLSLLEDIKKLLVIKRKPNRN